MGFYGFLAVGGGAAFGASLRWWLGILLNPLFPTLPFGTLAANLIGGYLVGVALAFFAGHAGHAGLPPEARLFVITGFMGGLTTFSTFSAEAVALFSRAEYGWAFLHMAVHLGGSLALTALGMLTVKLLQAKGAA
jgi:fluoride exporter